MTGCTGRVVGIVPIAHGVVVANIAGDGGCGRGTGAAADVAAMTSQLIEDGIVETGIVAVSILDRQEPGQARVNGIVVETDLMPAVGVAARRVEVTLGARIAGGETADPVRVLGRSAATTVLVTVVGRAGGAIPSNPGNEILAAVDMVGNGGAVTETAIETILGAGALVAGSADVGTGAIGAGMVIMGIADIAARTIAMTDGAIIRRGRGTVPGRSLSHATTTIVVAIEGRAGAEVVAHGDIGVTGVSDAALEVDGTIEVISCRSGLVGLVTVTVIAIDRSVNKLLGATSTAGAVVGIAVRCVIV